MGLIRVRKTRCPASSMPPNAMELGATASYRTKIRSRNDRSIARASGRHADRKRGAPTESERYFSHGWLKDGGRYPRNAGFGNSSNPKSREKFSRSSARNLGIAVIPWSAQRRHSEAV